MKKYKNVSTWANAMRKDKKAKLWFDWFNIGGDWYVIEEYDISGKYMRFFCVPCYTISMIRGEDYKFND